MQQLMPRWTVWQRSRLPWACQALQVGLSDLREDARVPHLKVGEHGMPWMPPSAGRTATCMHVTRLQGMLTAALHAGAWGPWAGAGMATSLACHCICCGHSRPRPLPEHLGWVQDWAPCSLLWD